MSLETPPTLTNQLSATLHKLQSDLENIQREVDQALGVWRQTLIAEKKESQDAFQEKEKTWVAQENEWLEQKSVFETKIQELDQFYKTQISSMEQNALQALNELDDSWQRDKVLWNQAAAERMKEIETRELMLSGECQKREANEKVLDARIMELSNALADKGREQEEQIAQWQSRHDANVAKVTELEETGRTAEKNREQSHVEAVEALKTSWAQEKINWQTERDTLESQRRAAEDAFNNAEKIREQSHAEAIDALKATWAQEKATWQAERDALGVQRRTVEESFLIAEKTRDLKQADVIEQLKQSWEREKAAWTESHQQELQKYSVSEKAWADEWQRQNRKIRELEEQFSTVQAKLHEASARSSNSDHLMWASLDALDNQVSLLNQVLELAARPLHPLRRRTDSVSDAQR